MPPENLSPLLDSEFDADYDFAIKHDLIQSDSRVMTLLWSIRLNAFEKSMSAIMTAFGMVDLSV